MARLVLLEVTGQQIPPLPALSNEDSEESDVELPNAQD